MATVHSVVFFAPKLREWPVTKASSRTLSGPFAQSRRNGWHSVATAGEACKGSVRMWRGKTTFAGRSFAIGADRWTKVRLHLKKGAYRQLVRKRALTVKVRVLSRGADGVLRRATVSVTLLAPKR